MGKPLSLEQRQAWAKKIQTQKESGLSIDHWCKNNQIAPHVFHYWKRRLFSDPVSRSSFTELTSQRGCAIDIDYQNVRIHIDAPSLKQAFQALRELKC